MGSLSVVVPCHDAAGTLGDLLTALAGEELDEPWEVVVVDNLSTDGTRAVAESFAAKLPVRVVEAAGRAGPGYARNTGAAAATGDRLLFLDDDDVVAPGYLRAIRDALADADLVAARLEVATLNEPWLAESRPVVDRDGLLDHFGFLPYAPSCGLGVHRAVFDSLGGFADGDAEDVDLSWRAQLDGRRIHPVPEALVHYRYRSTIRATFRQARRYGRAHPLLYRRFRRMGMPGRPLGEAMRAWRGILVQLAHARSRRELAAALYLLGVYVGRVEGSVRYRSLYV